MVSWTLVVISCYYLVLEIQILIPLVRNRVVGITIICRVLPVHHSTRILPHSCWLVRRVFVLRYSGPVHICLRVVHNLDSGLL